MTNERLTVMINSGLSHSMSLEHLEVNSLSIHIFIQHHCLCSIVGGMDHINISRTKMNSTLLYCKGTHALQCPLLTLASIEYLLYMLLCYPHISSIISSPSNHVASCMNHLHSINAPLHVPLFTVLHFLFV